MTCLIAPPAPRGHVFAPASGGAPPSPAASQLTGTVEVRRVGSQAVPSGSGPSATESVTTTGPGTAQVKRVLAAVGAENEPLGADQAYVRLPGSTPTAVPVRATELPTDVSEGLADTPPATPQLNGWTETAAEPASGAPTLH